jgi:hypothetical protein
LPLVITGHTYDCLCTWPSIFCDTRAGEDFSASPSASVARYHPWPGRPGDRLRPFESVVALHEYNHHDQLRRRLAREVLGSGVPFLNTDTRPHAMSSDAIQVHTDCPPINDVGFLNLGQRGTTGVLDVKRTCGFHDHTNENDAIFKGRIVIE